MKSFTLKLNGPSPSGKSTFIDMIIDHLANENVAIVQTGEHELNVTLINKEHRKEILYQERELRWSIDSLTKAIHSLIRQNHRLGDS